MLKLISNSNQQFNQFDLAWVEPETENEVKQHLLESSVWAALFSDARINDDLALRRVPEYTDRRGWWADPNFGSGLWHLRRQPLSAEARAETVTEVKRALEVYVPDDFTEINVVEFGDQSLFLERSRKELTSSPLGDHSGNISTVILQITAIYTNGRVSLAVNI